MSKNSKQSGPRPPRYKGKSRLPLSPAEISHRKAKARLLRARGGSAEDPHPFNDRSEVLALCRTAGIEHLIDDDRMATLQRSLQLITGDFLSLHQQALDAPENDSLRRFCSSIASKSRDLVCALDGGSKSDARDLDLESVKSQVLPEPLLRLANLARLAWRASDPQEQEHSDKSVQNALNSLEAMGVEPEGLLDEVRSVARALHVLECVSILARGTRSTPRVNQKQVLLYGIGAAFEAATQKDADQGLAFRIFAEGVFRSVGMHFHSQDALRWTIADALRSAKSDDCVEVWSTEDGLRATTREPTLSTEKSAPRRVRKSQ